MSGKSVTPARAALGGDNWIVSETTSPVDYTPVVAASTFSRGGSDGSSMQLSIHCRAGRTELVVAGPAVRSGEDYAISYRINDDRPVQLVAGPPRLERALPSRATSSACCGRFPRRATSPSVC